MRTVMKFPQGRSRGRRGLHSRDDRGATAVEYGLMVGFIAVVIVVSVKAFGGAVQALFDFIVNAHPFG